MFICILHVYIHTYMILHIIYICISRYIHTHTWHKEVFERYTKASRLNKVSICNRSRSLPTKGDRRVPDEQEGGKGKHLGSRDGLFPH